MLKRSRSEQASVNRARVLDAAQDVFSRKGYHAASLDEIADAAGFSKGVVYSQFGSKDDLFLAVLERRIELRAERNLATVNKAEEGAAFMDLWRLSQETQRTGRGWLLAVLEFRTHAARNSQLNQRYGQLHAQTIAGLAATLEALAVRSGARPPYPVNDLATLLAALDNGSALEDLVSESPTAAELARRAFAKLLTEPGTIQPVEDQK